MSCGVIYLIPFFEENEEEERERITKNCRRRDEMSKKGR
jgi:hypothetical protein